ncbi:MAG: FecR domain-containing protein [bacterium]|nr:FecR domain-containing protein [bacterium]
MRKTLITTLLALIATGGAVASTEDELTSLSYISYLERYATVQPGDQEQSLEAIINMPVVSGDRIDTAREARVEVQLSDGSIVWLDQYSAVSFDAVAYSRDAASDRTVLYLVEGAIMVEIPENALPSQPMRIDGSSATVHLPSAGLYLVEALRPGGLRVEAWEGLAEISTTSGGVLVRAESSAEVRDGQLLNNEFALTVESSFAQWVQLRRQFPQGDSSQHLDMRYNRQAAQLDNYGEWVYLENNDTWAWRPAVSSGWQPYSAGRWYWTNTGWAWISYEPWGWLPYHYGSWSLSAGFGWVWSWGSCWGPAWVSWISWPGYIGWCPMGYHSSWYWNNWGYRPGYPGYPGGPGGGSGYYRPPRSDVVPPRSGAVADGSGGGSGAVPRTVGTSKDSISVRGDSPRAIPASEVALDLRGSSRLDQIDPRGWSVAAVEDFNSPHLSRLARSGEKVFPVSSGTDGVVYSGPLVTRSPNSSDPRRELEGLFNDVGRSHQVDVTPILSRRNDLSAAEVSRLAAPISQVEMSRRSSPSQQSSTRSTAVSASPILARGAFQTGTDSRGVDTLRSSPDRQHNRPNLYRPSSRTNVYSGSPTAQSLDGNSSLSGRRPVLRQPTGSSAGRGSLNAPRQRSIGTRQPTLAPRSSTGPRVSSPRSSGPVLVPRTSMSRPSRQMSGGSPSTRSSRSRGSSIKSSPSSSSSRGSSASPGRSRAPSPSAAGSGRSSSPQSRSSASPKQRR